MFEKIRDFYYSIEDTMSTILAVFVTILFGALALGLVFGVYCFFGWILMIVWEALATAFGLPLFNFWVYVAFVMLIAFFRGGISIKTKV